MQLKLESTFDLNSNLFDKSVIESMQFREFNGDQLPDDIRDELLSKFDSDLTIAIRELILLNKEMLLSKNRKLEYVNCSPDRIRIRTIQRVSFLTENELNDILESLRKLEKRNGSDYDTHKIKHLLLRESNELVLQNDN